MSKWRRFLEKYNYNKAPSGIYYLKINDNYYIIPWWLEY